MRRCLTPHGDDPRRRSGARRHRGVLGNHDAAEVAVEFEKMGVRTLVNESVEIKRAGASIWVAGVDEPHYYGCDDMPAARA